MKMDWEKGLVEAWNLLSYFLAGILTAVVIALGISLVFVLPLGAIAWFTTQTWPDFYNYILRGLFVLSCLGAMIGAIVYMKKWHRGREMHATRVKAHNRRALLVVGSSIVVLILFHQSVSFWNLVNPRIFTQPVSENEISWYVRYLTYNAATFDFFDHFKMPMTSVEHSGHLSFSIYTYVYRLFCMFVVLVVAFDFGNLEKRFDTWANKVIEDMDNKAEDVEKKA